MIKKTIEMSRQPVHLAVRHDQLVVQPFDEAKDQARTIPCEDIGVLLIDEPRCSMTQGAVQALMKHGAVVIVCGRDHLPAGVMLPTNRHTEQVPRLHEQIGASKPLRKRLWKQLVQAKIRHHAVLYTGDPTTQLKLDALVKEVRSGDPTNIEGQAARVHWAAWRRQLPELRHFKRDPDGRDIGNVLLNYGYAILRAAVARSLVSAGLHPALGLHHHHRSNAFCLADDMMEPLRPMIDRRVMRLLRRGAEQLGQSTKAGLLPVLTDAVTSNDQQGPLMVNLPRMTASLVACYRNQAKRLSIPEPVEDDR